MLKLRELQQQQHFYKANLEERNSSSESKSILAVRAQQSIVALIKVTTASGEKKRKSQNGQKASQHGKSITVRLSLFNCATEYWHIARWFAFKLNPALERWPAAAAAAAWAGKRQKKEEKEETEIAGRLKKKEEKKRKRRKQTNPSGENKTQKKRER